jgi:Transcriptional regulators
MKQNGKKTLLVPRYMQIREKLLARLSSEDPGCPECLPKEEELCRLYRVSRSTIAKALDGLVEQGLVRRIKRKGTVINHRRLQSLFRKKSTQEISVVFPLTNYWQKALKAMFDEAGKQGFSLTILPYDWHSLDSETEAVEKALRNSCGLVLYPGAHRKANR